MKHFYSDPAFNPITCLHGNRPRVCQSEGSSGCNTDGYRTNPQGSAEPGRYFRLFLQAPPPGVAGEAPSPLRCHCCQATEDLGAAVATVDLQEVLLQKHKNLQFNARRCLLKSFSTLIPTLPYYTFKFALFQILNEFFTLIFFYIK